MLWARATPPEDVATTTGTLRLPVVFAVGGEDLALEVSVAPGAAVADLIHALAGGATAPATVAVIDGRAHSADETVAETTLAPGSRIELSAAGTPGVVAAIADRPVAELRVVGGVRAGQRFGLTPGKHIVGRGDTCDIRIEAQTVSAVHAILDVAPSGEVTIADRGALNGIRLDGGFISRPTVFPIGSVADIGAVQVSIAEPVTTRRRRGSFNRPPRSAPSRPMAPLVGPAAPSPVVSRSRFSWTAVGLPLVMGAVLALVWDPRMAAFALLSPLFAVGNWWEERRRARRDRRTASNDLERGLAQFAAEIGAAAAREVDRRRELAPDPAAVAALVVSDDPRLWQRRGDHANAWSVRLGAGDEHWRPPVEDERALAPEAKRALAAATLQGAPTVVELAPGSVLGIVTGEPGLGSGLARSVVLQLAAQMGPADVRIAVFTTDDRTGEWAWARWLPHTAATGEAGGVHLLAASGRDVDVVAGALTSMAQVPRIVVVDAPGLTSGRRAPVRSLLAGTAGPVAGIVITAERAALPASCTHIVEIVDGDGTASLVETSTGRTVDGLVVTGIRASAAVEPARVLAGVDDPESADGASALPAHVRLLDLLDVEPSPEALAAAWRAHDATTVLPATVGVGDEGPLVIDLVHDGPHGLLGGTTGAGKSELLRTLVASLGATVSPERLNIVLIDFKGGSAFDACARLPHTVGVVTDLDEHLGQRALRCLEAELRYREGVLRNEGAIDIVHYESVRRGAPLPRLLVVVDEFATLAAELPDFVDSLVGIAQRGRSLGVHLILATQRPGGAVKDNIRANTNLRIALRMQDATDSNDVLGVPDAAAIGRRQPGRGLARLGPGEVVAFQTALVSDHAPADATSQPVTVRALEFGPGVESTRASRHPAGPTDLERLVDAAARAATGLGLADPRRPWPEPLPDDISLGSLPAGCVGALDDPVRQCQRLFRWTPRSGNLLVYGSPGSGTTTVLEALALSIARATPPSEAHLYALDFGAGRLASLGQLPHTGAVVGATETERQRRLVRFLRAELDRRLDDAGERSARLPSLVLFLDGWSAFAAAFDDVDGLEVREQLERVVADGPAVGISTVITGDRPNAIPLSLAGLVSAKIVLRLADRHDWSAFGVSSTDIPSPVCGRGIETESGLEVQIARPDDAARRLVIRGPKTAPPVATLPRDLPLSAVAGESWDGERWDLLIGMSGTALTPAGLRFHPADHAIVSGPARSGRSTALVALAEAASAGTRGCAVSAIALRPSPLRALDRRIRVASTAADAAALVASVDADLRPHLLLIDDAETVDDSDGSLAMLLGRVRPDVHVVAAGRAEALRTGYGHWTRDLRRSRLGLALHPQMEDGDLFGAAFPRRLLPAPVAGRGVLVVDGQPEVLQVARP